MNLSVVEFIPIDFFAESVCRPLSNRTSLGVGMIHQCVRAVLEISRSRVRLPLGSSSRYMGTYRDFQSLSAREVCFRTEFPSRPTDIVYKLYPSSTNMRETWGHRSTPATIT